MYKHCSFLLVRKVFRANHDLLNWYVERSFSHFSVSGAFYIPKMSLGKPWRLMCRIWGAPECWCMHGVREHQAQCQIWMKSQNRKGMRKECHEQGRQDGWMSKGGKEDMANIYGIPVLLEVHLKKADVDLACGKVVI